MEITVEYVAKKKVKVRKHCEGMFKETGPITADKYTQTELEVIAAIAGLWVDSITRITKHDVSR